MPYHHFTPEDFVADAYFRKWALDPDQETQAFWSHWLEEHPDKKKEVEAAKEILRSSRFHHYQASLADFKEVWAGIETHRNKKLPLIFPKAHRQVKRQQMHRLWLSVAASVGVLVLLFYLLTYPWHYETYRAAYGETKTIVLPDQTEVILNANSVLKFEKHWQENQKREVWLEGEAFFHVSKLKSTDTSPIPFLVHTEELEVEVLGTQFNVQARRGETKVVLSSGKVKINLKKQHEDEIYMEPGDLVKVSQKHQTIVRRRVNPEKYASWRNNWLEFDGATLAEIKEMLEDYYGYKVIIRDETLAKRKFKGSFPLYKVDVLLQALATSLDIQVSRDHKQILIQHH